MTQDIAQRVQRSFSRSFSSYHDAAYQQAWIAGRLVQELRDAGAPRQFRSTLELGCGTGHLTERLLAAFELKEVSLNDISPEAQATADRCGARFLCGDATKIDWPRQPDFIVSASMIQWLTEPALLLRRAADRLAPGGWLAVSGFGPHQYRELVEIGSSAMAPGLCRASDLAAISGDEIEVKAISECMRPLKFKNPRNVLEHLRKTGVNGRAQKSWTKSSLARFTADYIQRFGENDGVSLTYHAIWMVARKKQ